MSATDSADGPARRPNRLFRNLWSKIAGIPMILVSMGVFVGGTIGTVVYSFTDSKLLPRLNWVGLDKYECLWGTRRWLVSIENPAFYGIFSLVLTMGLGFFLATLLDRKIRFEDTFWCDGFGRVRCAQNPAIHLLLNVRAL